MSAAPQRIEAQAIERFGWPHPGIARSSNVILAEQEGAPAAAQRSSPSATR
jgi:hypothetical protein